MKFQDRKSFIKTLGLLSAGAVLPNHASAGGRASDKRIQTNKPIDRKKDVKRSIRMAHLTDIHIKNERIAEYGMAAALREANSHPDKVDFIMNGGDSIMNAIGHTRLNIKNQWQAFHSIVKSDSSLPMYHCIGNHDIIGWVMPDKDHREAKKWVMDEYKIVRPYYSFSKNNWKFIVLDSIHGRKSIPGYYGKLDVEQMQWLKDELATTPADTFVCIVSHIPILAICCIFDNGMGEIKENNRKISDNNMHADAGDLIEIFYEHKNIRACLSGHIHLIDYVNYQGVDYYCNGAVAGGWWKGPLRHFAPSYSVMNFYEDGSTSREVNYYKWKA
ncbi:MAG: metallophosphoesterase [Bacteroidetes bacterium]|nr:metallophosphoesterase [Bacteroidota bacterium]